MILGQRSIRVYNEWHGIHYLFPKCLHPVEMSTETKLAGLVILVQALGDCDLKQGCVYKPGVCPLLL